MKISRSSLAVLGAFFVLPWAAMAVPLTTAVVEKPLDSGGYGFTSHFGHQQIFENFSLSGTETINRITWYGLFSEGTHCKRAVQLGWIETASRRDRVHLREITTSYFQAPLRRNFSLIRILYVPCAK